MKKDIWKWGNKITEEVNEVKYLGYTMQKNNGTDAHIRETKRKATKAIAQIWGHGERKFSEEYWIRIMLEFGFLRYRVPSPRG